MILVKGISQKYAEISYSDYRRTKGGRWRRRRRTDVVAGEEGRRQEKTHVGAVLTVKCVRSAVEKGPEMSEIIADDSGR